MLSMLRCGFIERDGPLLESDLDEARSLLSREIEGTMCNQRQVELTPSP